MTRSALLEIVDKYAKKMKDNDYYQICQILKNNSLETTKKYRLSIIKAFVDTNYERMGNVEVHPRINFIDFTLNLSYESYEIIKNVCNKHYAFRANVLDKDNEDFEKLENLEILMRTNDTEYVRTSTNEQEENEYLEVNTNYYFNDIVLLDNSL